MRSGNRYRRLYSGGLAWASQYIALDGTRPAIIADFNRGLYAVPAGLTSTMAGSASIDQLTRLRAATFDEVFALAATSTTARSYVAQSGLLLNDLAANQPRFSFHNGKRQLLLENQAINYCQQSTLSTISAVSGGSRSTVSGVYGLNGALFTEDAATSSHFIQPLGNRTVTVGMNYTMSAIIRGTGRSLVQYTFSTVSFPAGQWCNFGLTGAGAVSATGGTGTILALTDQWAGYYYVTFTATASTASSALGQFATITSMADTRMPSVAGLNASAYEIYAYQMEENVTFASSHIPTSGAIVTRAIESSQVSALTQALVSRAACTIAVRGRLSNTGTAARALFGNDSSGTLLFAQTASQTVAANFNGTSTVSATLGSGAFNTSAFGAALAFDATGRAVCANGGSVGSDAAAVGTKAVTYLGRSPGSSTYGDGFYDALVIYPSRVTAGALQSLAVAL